jgi:hypothetical protein
MPFSAARPWILFAAAGWCLLASSCGQPAATPAPPPPSPLQAARLFHASFDQGPHADFSKGDRTLYTVDAYDKIGERVEGIVSPDIALDTLDAAFGQSLRFQKRERRQLLFMARDNVAFSPAGWNGTISFWLRVDPANELPPGFTDPIQVTDAAYDDTCIWVDFTKENPRQFRLGIFGNRDSWNPANLDTSKNPDFEKRLIPVTDLPFAGDRWTHVLITHEALGTAQGKGSLWLNGVKQGEKTGIADRFEWDMNSATIRVGVSFVGAFDELSIFDRPLTDAEVSRVFAARGDAKTLQ